MAESDAIAGEAKPRLPRGVRLTHNEAQGGWVLLAPERIFKADAIAVEILKRCTGETTFAAIVDNLATTFNAPREPHRRRTIVATYIDAELRSDAEVEVRRGKKEQWREAVQRDRVRAVSSRPDPGELHSEARKESDVVGQRQCDRHHRLNAKRLERGRFVWPKTDSGTVSLTRAQLSMLLEGIDWREPARTWKPEMAV